MINATIEKTFRIKLPVADGGEIVIDQAEKTDVEGLTVWKGLIGNEGVRIVTMGPKFEGFLNEIFESGAIEKR